MILARKVRFFHLLCLSKIDRKQVFADVLDKKKPLKIIKTTVYKNARLQIFERE